MVVQPFISLIFFCSISNLLHCLLSDFLCLLSSWYFYGLNSSCHPEFSIPVENGTEMQEQSSCKTTGISVGEIKMVMRKLGMASETEAKEEDEEIVLKEDEFEGVFREEEPSLEELREAFDVFDQNRDGVIDAEELARVLSGIGSINKSGSDGSDILERCKTMITSFDRNQVGLLDFRDFLKLMEMSLHHS